MFAEEIPPQWKQDFNEACEPGCTRLKEIQLYDFSIIRTLMEQARSSRNPIKIGKNILQAAKAYKKAENDVKQFAKDSIECESGVVCIRTDLGMYPICGLVAVEGPSEIIDQLEIIQADESN